MTGGRNLAVVIAVLAVLGGTLAGWDDALGARADEGVDRFDTVILDAGHGGSDDGALGPNGQLEKQVALDVTRALARRLRARGLRVVMTRSDDTFVPLEERTAIANDARGDLFVSIHANAARDARIHGSETYFPRAGSERRRSGGPSPSARTSLSRRARAPSKRSPIPSSRCSAT